MKQLKKSLIFSLLIVVQIPLSAFAAPVRGAISPSLSAEYTQPALRNENSSSYDDLLNFTGAATPGTYEANYQSDDPITMVSLYGGRISKVERASDGSSLKVTFTVPGESAGVKSFLKLNIFTASRYQGAANADGLLEALTGSWFDSMSASVVGYPFFTDEGFDAIYVSFVPEDTVVQNDTLRAFFPKSVLEYTGKNYLKKNKISLKNLLVTKSILTNVEGTKIPDFNAGTEVDGGILVSQTHTFLEPEYAVQLIVSATANTGIYVRKDAEEFTYLKVTVRDCSGNETIKLQKKREEDDKFKRFKTLTLTNCEAITQFKLKETTVFSFKLNKKTYSTTVRAR